MNAQHEPFKITPEFDKLLETAVAEQLRASRDEFDAWLPQLDVLHLMEQSMGETSPLMRQMIRLLARRLCWEGWKAREPVMAMHNLRTAAGRDLLKKYEAKCATNTALVAQNKTLMEQNAQLRATIDKVLSV